MSKTCPKKLDHLTSHFLVFKGKYKGKILTLLGGEQAWTPSLYLKSFNMDSVQVGNAIFGKEIYTTLGIEPRTYSYPGRYGNLSSSAENTCQSFPVHREGFSDPLPVEKLMLRDCPYSTKTREVLGNPSLVLVEHGYSVQCNVQCALLLPGAESM